MGSRLVVCLALGSMLLADAPAQAQRGRRGDWGAVHNRWLFNLEDGKALAQRSGKPLMVVLRCVP